MKKIFATFLCLIAITATAADWLPLSSTDDLIFEGRAGSREFSTTRGGNQIVIASGRVINKKTQKITFEKWYVGVDECRTGYGKIVTLNMDGSFSFENNFVLKGGSVASILADVLCYGVFEADKEADKKGV